jgi:protein-arginine kinase
MKEDVKKQLIEDHFLFKEADKYLEAIGLNDDWPKDRGIFHNKDKTFLTWVNEEDQMRIISMQPGSDIKAVYERLCTACNQLNRELKFSISKEWGYLTSCPTNCGTALRASVHIKLPKLGANKPEFEKIAAEFNLQIRGIHGEHSESADHIYDISNKRRMGFSTHSLVQDMYNGVKAMCA